MITLCVNIDHVATVRQARQGPEPDPVHAAILCQLAGAAGITFHLREDRRHIQDRDVQLLKAVINIKLNMEMAHTAEMIGLAKQFSPHQVTLVPEKRQELTTEGGLDVVKHLGAIRATVANLQSNGIPVSLFIDADKEQIKAAAASGAIAIELHTGEYANAATAEDIAGQLQKLYEAATQAHNLGLRVYAGHGLNYQNVKGILEIPFLEELNIGHSIVSRAVLVGITEAVKEMLALVKKSTPQLQT